MDDRPAGFDTRGAYAPEYHLITPENRMPSALPELAATVVTKLVTPRRAPAAFAQYLLEVEPGGGSAGAQVAIDCTYAHAFYGLGGDAVVTLGGQTHTLAPGCFAYAPPGCEVALDHAPTAEHPAAVLWFKRAYHRLPGVSQVDEPLFGDQAKLDEPEFQPGLHRTVLFGDGDARHDYVLIRMRFDPGVGLGMTELHEEEHGLYMTAGRGTYLLGRDTHEVRAGDFIYMAPYCPQSFVADATTGAEYLLYKDALR